MLGADEAFPQVALYLVSRALCGRTVAAAGVPFPVGDSECFSVGALVLRTAALL